MKLIVADTGPINYLIQIGCTEVLPGLVEAVILPMEVLGELLADGAPLAVKAWAEVLPAWIEVRQAEDLIPSEVDGSRCHIACQGNGCLATDG